MGIKEFRIYFDNPVATYYGGDAVTGKVVIKLDSRKKIRCITARFRGEGNVKWTETESERDSDGNSRTVYIDYTAHEEYFTATHYLLGNPSQEFVLPPGVHTYQFSTTLPPYLPSSFEGKYGHVRYTLKVKMDRPWNFDHEAKVAFTVLSHLDLNVEPLLKEPISRINEKTLCCCCCISGPLTLIATVPATGFVSGQEIPVTVEVDNLTNETINEVVCSLKKKVSFHSGSPRKKTKELTDKVMIISFPSVHPNDSTTLTKKIKIPALPPSSLKYCSIIDLDYWLDVKAVIDGPHTNLNVKIPITIGTVPLLTYIPPGLTNSSYVPATNPPIQNPPSYLPQPVLPLQPSYPNAPYPAHTSTAAPLLPNQPALPNWEPTLMGSSNITPSAPPPPYQDLPPPSYEECMYGATNIHDEDDNEHTFGDTRFAPRYPTYNLYVGK